MNDTPTATLRLEPYDLHALQTLVDERPRLVLHPDVRTRIDAGARYVQAQAQSGRVIYGVNTGFGALAERSIDGAQLGELQRRHILSHACGVGPFAPEPIARFALLIKLLTFRSGHCGISVAAVERLIDLWNRDRVPAIPLQGTVGASGDLAPLAHLALPLLGLGHVHVGDRVVPTAEAGVGDGFTPLALQAKEGLALTNGIQFIAAIGAHSLILCEQLARAADVIASLSIQAFSCARDFFAARYHETSGNLERRIVAANLRALTGGSNHHALPTAVASKQDPYSFRCIPQVHGAVRQTLAFASDVLHKEVNGVSDNPLFFPDDDEILCGGNLHGESIAMALDFLAVAMSELCSISERRSYQLLSGRRGLPDFLVHEAGLNSGFMVAQYTAAALVNHNKVLCTPASVDTIPTCQLQEDHVSMGGTSGIKLLQILDNCQHILAIELLLAMQGIDFSVEKGLIVSPRTAPLFDAFRQQIPPLTEDRVLSFDIEKARRFLQGQLRIWSRELA